MTRTVERRTELNGRRPAGDPTTLPAGWELYDAARNTCRDVREAFDEAVARVRDVGGGPHPSDASAKAGCYAVETLHALEMAELIHRRAAYEAIAATVGHETVDSRRRGGADKALVGRRGDL